MANWPAIGATLLPNVGGWIGGIISNPHKKPKDGSMPWHESLKRPEWNPPSWVFGPVWTTLYCCMGYASYLVWKEGGGCSGAARLPLMLYASNLALNWAWPPIFFGFHSLKWSLVDIVALYANAIASGVAFYRITPMAGYLFVPYVAWLSLATCLNYRIWADNPEGGAKIRELDDKTQ